MSDKSIKLKFVSLYRADTGDWVISGRAPKGGFVRVNIVRLRLDSLRCAHRQIGSRIGELVAEQLAELDRVRGEMARQWRVVDATLNRTEPKP